MKLGVIVLIVVAFLAPVAKANPTTYTYTGNLFSSGQPPQPGLLSSSGGCLLCGVSGWFTLANPIISLNSDRQTIFPTDFSFTDGQFTITPAQAANELFAVSTHPDGSLNTWRISLESLEGGIATRFYGSAYEAADRAYAESGDGYAGSLQGNRGSWTVGPTATVTAVPESSTFFLLLAGLVSTMLLWGAFPAASRLKKMVP